MLNFVSVSDTKYTKLQDCTEEELSLLQQTIQQGWPDNGREVPIPIQPHWVSRSQLPMLNGIVHKRMRIVVPPTMRKHVRAHTPVSPRNGKEQTASMQSAIPARPER